MKVSETIMYTLHRQGCKRKIRDQLNLHALLHVPDLQARHVKSHPRSLGALGKSHYSYNCKADGNAKKNRKTNQKKHRDCDLYIVYTYTLYFLCSLLFGEGLCTLHICQTRDHAADKRLHLLAMSHPRWSLKSWNFKGAPPNATTPPKK